MGTERSERGAGRPLKWSDFEDFERQVNDYFRVCDESERPYTMTGLAMHLGTNRMTLYNIETRGDYDERYIEVIGLAKQRCELWLEESLLTNRGNVVGAIFTLKNNFGWKDKSEKEVTLGDNFTKVLEERRRKVIEHKVIDIEEVQDEVDQ